MKKRSLLLLLFFTCLLTLSGCGKAQEKPQTETETKTEKNNNDMDKEKKEKDKKESKTSKKNDKDRSDSAKSLPVIRYEQEQKQWYVPDSTNLLCEATYETIYLDDPEYTPLADALTSYCDANTEAILECAETNVDDCIANSFLMDYIDEYSYYTFDTSYTHTRFDHKVLSIYKYYSDYLLGPHGSYYFDGITFDVETGKQLALTDLAKDDYNAFESFVREYLVAELISSYEEELFSTEELASTINSYLLGSDIPWYLNGNGLVFIFNIYSIGPYSMGSAEVCIPYTELTPYIKREYLPNNGAYIAKLSADIPSCYKRSLSNNEATICINTNINEESDGGVSVTTSTSEVILTDYGYFDSAYFIRKSDGTDYLFTCVDLMSGDYETTLYRLENDILTQVNQLSGHTLKGKTIFEDSFTCTKYFYVLGTYVADMHYDWNDDDSFILKNNSFSFNVSNYGKMTTLLPLPVTMNGTSTTLPVGTKLQITGYDGDSTAFFRIIETGETGEINIIRDEYIYRINGISEYDYFDFVPYAG